MDCDESLPEDETIQNVDDSHMDFEMTADLMEEDAPSILSAGVSEVLHLFANMLDIKSFMRLAITSKDMYERCMENKRIRINIEEKSVAIRESTPEFSSSVVTKNHTEKYLETLRELKCNVSLKRLELQGYEIVVDTIAETHRYLNEIGVKRVDRLRIDMKETTAWPQIVFFIKDLHVKNIDFCCDLPPENILRSSFQWNVNSLFYDRPIRGELLLEMDTSVPHLKFHSIEASADLLMQILWKVHIGPLKTLSTSVRSIPWDNFTSVPSNYHDPLPAERPLLVKEYDLPRWLLHWNGDVTACRQRYNQFVEFSKCEKDDIPLVLQPHERVHKVLAEKSKEKCYCPKSHFKSFFDGYTVLENDHEGPFPDERPLLFKSDEWYSDLNYGLLNEDGSMDVYYYDSSAYYKGHYDLEKCEWPPGDTHLPLLKFLVKKRIEKRLVEGSFDCRNTVEFRWLFGDFEPLPLDFGGQLPERRPLVFGRTLVSEDEDEERGEEDDFRVVLYEDGTLIEYTFDYIRGSVDIGPCTTCNLPSMAITPENLKEILRAAPGKEFIYNIDLDMFRDAFKGIKTLSFHAFGDLPTERPLVFKKTEVNHDQRWFVCEYGIVTKCEWKNGRATFSQGEPREFPFALTKALLTDFFKCKESNIDLGFSIDRDVLNQCLGDCKILAYDHVGSLSNHRPLFFGKTEVKHTCQENPNGDCECVDEILHLCFVDDLEQVFYIRWEDRFLSFKKKPDPDDLPSAVKTKEMLEYLLKQSWNSDGWEMKWYGSTEDFVSYFEGHEMVDFKHKGALPEARPLVFKKHDSYNRERTPDYWFLRKDGRLVECEKRNSHTLITLDPECGHPPAISTSS